MPKIASLLGVDVRSRDTIDALLALHFEVKEEFDHLKVVPPSHRQDIEREVDLIEEVGRSMGYDAIPERLPHIVGTGGIARTGEKRDSRIRRALQAAGYSEVCTTSFVASSLDWTLRQRLVNEEPAIEPLRIANPIAADQEVLRTTLLTGVLAVVARNVNRGIKDVRVFEIGHTFRKGQAPEPSHDERKHPPDPPVDENVHLGIALTGDVHPRHWLERTREGSFYDLKGLIQSILAETGLTPTFHMLLDSEALETGSSARIDIDSEPVGRMGTLSTLARERFGIRQTVQVAELNLARLFLIPSTPMRYRPLPRYPAVSRDLSLVVETSLPYGPIEQTIREAAPDHVARVSIVDRYCSEELPRGTVGMTVNVVYQDPDRTMTSEEIVDLQGKILAELTRKYGVRLRD